MEAPAGADMTSGALIHGSAVLEPWIARLVAAMLVVVGIDWLLAGRRALPAPSLDAPMDSRTERRLLALVLLLAIVLRLVGWDSEATPVFWFSEISTLHVDYWLRIGALWDMWLRELRATQVVGAHDSAIVLPVITALQLLVGPRFGLPVLCGALFGSLAVWLAWAFGRRIRSQAFGLVFAAFVACSPLALMWSRLSGFCIAATTHVLLALLVGYEAGRRSSVLLAIVAGLVAWTSTYEYYPARLSLPLAVMAMVAGSQRAMRVPRGVALATIAVAVFVAAAQIAYRDATPQALWPSYGGYAGNRGERTLVEFFQRNLDSFQDELRNALERYFMLRRAGWMSQVAWPGIYHGGLCMLPVALLGIVGVIATCRRLGRHWLWLVFAIAGLAVPALSVMTARRTLLFDLAWCGLAAHGLLALVDGLGARLAHAARARIVAIVVGLVGAWSAAAVFVLSAALPATAGQHIPFGDAGFGDGVACRRCLEAAKSWVPEMAGGAFVVLFDNDMFRENRTSPGGLIAYGKIATLVAGTPGRFVEGYGLMGAFDSEPPTRGALFDRSATDFLTHLRTQLERTAATRILWHFERPTPWERWLVRRLMAAGGRRESFATPLSPSSGIRIVTPAARRADAMAVLRELAQGLAPEDESPCIALTERAAVAARTAVLGIAPDGAGDTAPPEWLATSYETHRYKTFTFATPTVLGTRVDGNAAGGPRVEFLCEAGQRVDYQLPSMRRSALPPVRIGRSALNCAAYAAGHWWIVEPWSGRVVSTHPASSAVPKGTWMGIAADPSGTLVLASADQSIVVFDPERRQEIARFPARVSPSVREMPDECAPIAAGTDWIATADPRTTVLNVYDRSGRNLGTRRLDRLLRPPSSLSTIAGAGHYLGIAVGTMVRTMELRITPDCQSPAT